MRVTSGHAFLGSRHRKMAKKPMRTILLSRGRGGSQVLAKVISHFAHADTRMMSHELFGGSHEIMAQVAIRRNGPWKMMRNWFARWETQSPHARVIGFKWKPYMESRAYLEAWDWASSHNVSVLWMTRNLLNVLISNNKHDTPLPPHCQPNDNACIEEYQQLRVTLDPRTLISNLSHAKRKYETDLEALLVTKGVHYHKVSFDVLFESNGRSADHETALVAWNGVFGYLGIDRVDTYAKIISVADSISESTTPRTQCDSLGNAKAVRWTLKGTAFEGLLDC